VRWHDDSHSGGGPPGVIPLNRPGGEIDENNKGVMDHSKQLRRCT
jgi:hypothetical protein